MLAEQALAALPAGHRAFVERALPVLAADPRTLAVAGAGSWATGGMDEFSDLDLVIVVADDARDAAVRDARAVAASLGDLLVGFSGEHVGAPNLLICLYAPWTLHVDLKFAALDELRERIEDPVILLDRSGALAELVRTTTPRSLAPDLQWLEDRFWVWIHYTATKLARGELLECLDALAFLRKHVLCPLAMLRQGCEPRGTRRLEERARAELPALLRTVAPSGARECLSALRAALDLYLELREFHAQARPLIRQERARAAATDYLDRVAASLS